MAFYWNESSWVASTRIFIAHAHELRVDTLIILVCLFAGCCCGCCRSRSFRNMHLLLHCSVALLPNRSFSSLTFIICLYRVFFHSISIRFSCLSVYFFLSVSLFECVFMSLCVHVFAVFRPKNSLHFLSTDDLSLVYCAVRYVLTVHIRPESHLVFFL